MPITDDTKELSPDALRERAVTLLQTDPELACDADLHGDVVEELIERREELAGYLQDELKAVEAIKRRYPHPAVAALALALLVGISALTAYIWVRQPQFGLFDLQWRTVRWVAVALLVSALPLVVRVWRRYLSRLQARRLAYAQLNEGLRVQLPALIREVISELESAERRWANDFDATSAPALVELDISDTVSSATYTRIQTFIKGHVASAIGIAGPRGVGKSTLMHQLRSNQDISVHIPAPVDYRPIEFVRLIHAELAYTAVGRSTRRSSWGSRLVPPVRRALVPVLKVAGLLMASSLLVAAWVTDTQNISSANDLAEYGSRELEGYRVGLLGVGAIIGLAIIAGFILAKAWRIFQNRVRLIGYPSTVSGLAQQQLDLLRWSTSMRATAKTSLSFEQLGFEGENELSRTERELTHGESVQALRQFIQRLVALADQSILICIDELDKIADPDKAIQTVNGIKDLFHIPHVHFLVSVSSDALHRFAARGVPVRDVFDSSFDTVIQVAPLSFEESGQLIARRARRFPATVVMFCYAWSGGHARDLIRTARACVEFRRTRSAAIRLDKLVSHVLRTDLNEVLEAAVEKLHTYSTPTVDQILLFKDHLQTGNGHIADTILSALNDTPLPTGLSGTAEQEVLANALGPYARVAALIGRLFEHPRTPAEWQQKEVLNAIEALARVRRSLDCHPREIQRLLQTATDACAVVAQVDASQSVVLETSGTGSS
jgi:Cdc6-like AAA superfamily ATPase